MLDGNELRELYQEAILDHRGDPRNFSALDDATHQASGHNPLCGDRVKIFVRINGDLLDRITFQGAGCAISTASASMMTETLTGKTLPEAKRLIAQFTDVATGQSSDVEGLGDLKSLVGVRDFPARVKCATLAWRAIESTMRQNPSTISKEF